MSWQCTSWALREAPAPTANARLVLIALADRCGPDGRRAWPTITTLSQEAHCSKASTKRALKALEESGCIGVATNPSRSVTRTANGSRRNTVPSYGNAAWT